MKGPAWRARRLFSVLFLLLLFGGTSGWAGMAELGKNRNFTGGGPVSAWTDTANGGATVILMADAEVFFVNTFAGQTVDDILEALELDVNTSGADLLAVHGLESPEITVTRGLGEEVSRLSLQTTDTGFGHVDITRTKGGIVSVAGFALTPMVDGTATIYVDGVSAASVTGLSDPLSLNLALLSQLQANACDATLGEDGVFRILRNSSGDCPSSVAWENLYTFPDGLAPLVLARAEDAAGLPSAGTWGMVLLSLLLMGATTVVLLRRQRAVRAQV